jgi:hypothetical protein
MGKGAEHGGKSWILARRSLVWAASHAYCFYLALLWEVAMFTLFKCFSIFQNFRLFISDKGNLWSSGYFLLARDDVGGCWAWRECRSMMALNCSPKVAWEMTVICSYKNFWRTFIRHGRNIKARQTRMRGTANGMSHGYREERILVGCEDVSCCALSLSFFYSVSTYARFIGKETTIFP